ncbi:MAG: cytidine/deoxycytidylate deaminase family protein [Synergistaceae bacterium]|nr:cytidine/deoxycytidylate deaminase family protein [Synergistaceae bacterium]
MTSSPDDRKRPEWDAYFMAMALLASTRSTCVRRRVGAVIVKDNRVLATGYNGAPAGTMHCADTGCLRRRLGIPSGERHEICRGAHAEMNAISQAASSGTSIRSCAIYVTAEPCSMCSKLLINAGCARIVCMYPYPDDLSRTLLEEAGIASETYGDEGAVMNVLRSAMSSK